MSTVLSLLIAGLTTGSVYGMAGIGLVLTFKTSRIFNFAHGSLATVSAFTFYTLHVQHGIPWVVAALISVFVIGPLLGLLLEVFSRPLVDSSLVVRVVATLGLLLIVEGGVLLIYGTKVTRVVPQFLPTNHVTVDGIQVSVSDGVQFLLPLLATVGLWLYFRLARAGVAMRAVVDNADLLDLTGMSPAGVRRRAWVVGVTFAGLSGVLISPLLSQIDASSLTLLVITAFGAAAVGAFSSLPLTYAGGLFIGVAGAFATNYLTTGFLSQIPAALPFVILFIVLLVSPRRRLAVRETPHVDTGSVWRAPWHLQSGLGALLVAFLIAAPYVVGVHLGDWTLFLANVILFLSLGVLVRSSGQVSLCHVSFAAIGVASFSHLTVGLGLPWLLALMISGLIAVPIGALLAIPAIRLSGIYLALASLIHSQQRAVTPGSGSGP
jgi:branched-subunit amino acid ABC-type transport system permease component